MEQRFGELIAKQQEIIERQATLLESLSRENEARVAALEGEVGERQDSCRLESACQWRTSRVLEISG